MINKRWVALWSVLLVIGICFSCEHEDSVSKSMGQFSLRLSADTTSIMKDLSSGLTKSVASELEDFANIADYTVLVMKEKDTVVHYKRFDQMPASISLAEGAYQLIAKKGEDKPAEFLNPYFEGSTSFTIKEQMNTPLELTCTLANARVTVDYTNDFLEAYDEYTALLSTPFTTADVELPKGETRAVYLQVASGGTQMAVGIKLKKKTETAAKTYWVQTPINLARRQNVHLIFKTDGEALEGIGLQVLLDNTLTECKFTTEIPSFMWKPAGAPVLEAVNFEQGETISQISAVNREMQVGVSMNAGIGALHMKYWKDDEEDAAVVVDLVEDIESAQEMHLSWKNNETGEENQDLSGAKKAQIILTDLLSSLEKSPDREILHHFSFYGVDATPKEQATESLDFVVRAVNTPEPDIDSPDFTPIIEGNSMNEELIAWVTVTDEVDYKELILTINEQSYSLLDENVVDGLENQAISVEQNTEHQYKITFGKEFGSKWEKGTHSVKLYVKDTNDAEKSDEKQFIVKDPNVQLLSTEGDAFAKRIVLRSSMENEAQKEKLRFEYSTDGSSWQTIPNMKIKADGEQWVDTLRGLDPEKEYEVRAVYQSLVIDEEKIERMSETKSLETEKEDYAIPNKSFTDWYYDTKNGAYWEKWYPWKKDDVSTIGWNTLNLMTTQDGGTDLNTRERYVANSGTLQVTDVPDGSAALVRTVAWGKGTTAAGTSASIISHSTPGELYLGSVGDNYQPIYGYNFGSRPSGFSFQYKYENPMKGNDEFTAEIVVLDAQGQIMAQQQFTSSTVTSDWKSQAVYLKYPYGAAKATKIYIRFVSGKDGNYVYNDFPIKAPFANLSDGEYVGSQLYIDNVELIYE